jgi:hypothetical protein
MVGFVFVVAIVYPEEKSHNLKDISEGVGERAFYSVTRKYNRV